jgi:murein DD-endopeptidase MepM/ murein hydrolase activator NlpD
MKRAAGLLVVAYLIYVPCLLLILGGAAVSSTTECSTGVDEPQEAATAVGDLDAEQMANASRIVAAVRGYAPTSDEPYAAVVAIATAMQESTLRNLDYGDRDSLGLFQQRPSQGWGTPEQVRDVEYATRSFLQRLVEVPGWKEMPLTEAAATVQRPAEEYAGLYAQWESLGDQAVDVLWADAGPTSPAECDSVDAVGTGAGSSSAVGFPVPAGLLASDNHNWGGQGSMWSSWHTGTDFSVPCGTPVLAATSGTVVLERGPSWFGAVLVKIVTGPESVATWYAHMQSVSVQSGQRVATGQQIGQVGALGNASGCHLHFEVHLRNGDIYGADNVDPSTWLSAHARSGA